MRYRIGKEQNLLKFGDRVYVKRRCSKHRATFGYPDTYCSNRWRNERVFIYRGRDRYAVSDRNKYSLTYSGYRRESNNFENERIALECVCEKMHTGSAQTSLISVHLEDLANFEKQPIQVAILNKMKE